MRRPAAACDVHGGGERTPKGHNGKLANSRDPIHASGCAKHKQHKRHRR